jgi:hypothetical protein
MSSANEYPIFIKGDDGWRMETVSLKGKKMNNKGKIASLELKILNAQAVIKELESQQGKRFKPERAQEYWYICKGGKARYYLYDDDVIDKECFNNFNCYETEELATKAALMMRRSNAIIMACLQVDPDFVPDYLSSNQVHYSFSFLAGDISSRPRWIQSHSYTLNYGPCVSTQEKWEEAAALLTEWGIE